MGKRIVVFDVLRGLAILAIVLYHYTTGYQSWYGHPQNLLIYFSRGYLGVETFFILSGFFTLMSLNKNKNAIKFALKRFTRLYPSYWISLVFIFLLVSYFSLPGREISLNQLPINLTMTQHWFGVPDVDGSYWIFPVLLVFYGISFLIILLKQIHRIELIGILWMLLGILIWKGSLPQLEVLKSMLLFFYYSHLFLAGMMFYQLFIKKKITRSTIIILLTLMAHFFLFSRIEFLIMICIYLIMYLAVLKKLNFLNTKFLAWLGLISYQLFLIHQNTGYVIMRFLYSYNLPTGIVISISLAISIFLAWLIYLITTRLINSFSRFNNLSFLSVRPL